ncbi:MAG: hypothetical protein ACM31C_05845 [Acidobacteriota bacterium]
MALARGLLVSRAMRRADYAGGELMDVFAYVLWVAVLLFMLQQL